MFDVGMAGEFRFVVSDAKGCIKQDTGYQKNLILNQGLEFFGGGKGSNINEFCVIGQGNSVPTVTQNKLDSAISFVGSADKTSDYSYTDRGDNLYRMWEQRQYRFTGLNNVNISEVGLASQGDLSTHWLTTRALVKDALGNNVSISVKSGETLDVYYKIHKVIDTQDRLYTVNMLDGDGGSVPYNVVVRPAYVGSVYQKSIPHPIGFDKFFVGEGLVGISGFPSVIASYGGTLTSHPYTPNSYNKKFSLNFPLSASNNGFRSISTDLNQWNTDNSVEFQMRFGSVNGDLIIPKTKNHTLVIPFEVSWGRYEGVL